MLADFQAAIYSSALWKRNRSEPVHTDLQGISRSLFTLSLTLSLSLSLCVCVIDSDVGPHELPSLKRSGDIPSSGRVYGTNY